MLFILSAIFIFLTAWWLGWWFGAAVIFLFMFFAPFIDTPSGRQSGKLVYYGPLLIGEKARRGKVVLHGGTLFDYIFTLDELKPGRERTAAVIFGIKSGLENLAAGDLADETVLEGTSYFAGERTIRRYGFRTAPISFFRFAILVFNYPLLIVAKRYVKGRWEFPSPGNFRTFRGTVGELRRRLHELNAKGSQ